MPIPLHTTLGVAMKKLIVFVFLFMFITPVLAEEVLANLTSDVDNDTGKIAYEMDQDLRSFEHIFLDKYVGGARTERAEMNVQQLLNGGIVLLKVSNVNVVRIWSDNFDLERGGVLYLDTLYNGVSGERKQYTLEISKLNNGFGIFYNKTEYKNLKFIAKRSRVLGVVGIEKIQFSK